MDNPLEALLGDRQVEETHVEQPAAEVEAAPVAEAPAPEAQEAPPGPARGPDGKFLPKDATPAPAAPEPGHVPISALLDEREKRQAAETARKALEDRFAAQQREQAQPLPPDQAFEARLYAQNLRVSRKFAEKSYGPELTATVHEWAAARCDADPHFNAQMRSSDDPYEAAMQAYNRDQIAAKVTPDRLAAFEAWEKAQAELQAHQSNPVSSPAPSAPVPRSLANAPGSGGAGKEHIPTGEGLAFLNAIPR